MLLPSTCLPSTPAITPPDLAAAAIVNLISLSRTQIATALLIDLYEIVSLLFLKRKRPINLVAICVDVVVTAVGVFCFLAISMSGYNVYLGNFWAETDRAEWAAEIGYAMIFMMVFR